MLTSTQAAVLKAAVTSDAAVTSFIAKDDWFSVAANYNANTTNMIWRKDIQPSEILGAIQGSEAVKQSAQQLQLAQLLLTEQFIDATNSTVRAQFGAIFPSSSAVSTNAQLGVIAQRVATKFENLFTSSQVSTVYGYVLQPNDVQQAMS